MNRNFFVSDPDAANLSTGHTHGAEHDKDSHVASNADILTLSLPPHSVRVLKIEDENVPAMAPAVVADYPPAGVPETRLHSRHTRKMAIQWSLITGILEMA